MEPSSANIQSKEVGREKSEKLEWEVRKKKSENVERKNGENEMRKLRVKVWWEKWRAKESIMRK